MFAIKNLHIGRAKAATAGLLLFTVAACASPFTASVNRFQSQLPAPAALLTSSGSPPAAAAAATSPEMLRKFKSWWSQPKVEQQKN